MTAHFLPKVYHLCHIVVCSTSHYVQFDCKLLFKREEYNSKIGGLKWEYREYKSF